MSRATRQDQHHIEKLAFMPLAAPLLNRTNIRLRCCSNQQYADCNQTYDLMFHLIFHKRNQRANHDCHGADGLSLSANYWGAKTQRIEASREIGHFKWGPEQTARVKGSFLAALLGGRNSNWRHIAEPEFTAETKVSISRVCTG